MLLEREDKRGESDSPGESLSSFHLNFTLTAKVPAVIGKERSHCGRETEEVLSNGGKRG